MIGDGPEVFGEWLLVHRLAESQMAEAVIGVRLGDTSGRTFVIKRPRLGERASGAAAEALRREGEILGAVRSPYLVGLEATGTVGGLPFVALEHVRGVPLDRLLTGAGALADVEVRAIASDLLAALAALHRAGWVHGDVAPSNVVIDDAGEARLLDLGIAARLGEVRPSPAGKPGYVAPEAIGARGATAAIDVYGWAVVVAECLLGRRLFVEHDLTEAATRDGAPPTVAQLPGWGPLLAEALAVDPARRPDVAALRAAVAAGPTDRGALAGTVARARAAADRRVSVPTPIAGTVRELTPTAPLVVPVAPAMPVVTTPPPRHGATRRQLLGAVVGLAAGGAAGWLVGRRSSRRPRDASLGLSAALPPRGRLTIDGRTIVPPEPGKEIPVSPGRHTISITLPRRETETFDVVVGDGEHVVLLMQQIGTVTRRDRQGDREGDRRAPDGGRP